VSRRSLVLLLAAFAVPATAETYDFAVSRSLAACIEIADAQYRIAAPTEFADYTVRLDRAAAAPDLRIRLTDIVDEADFVLLGNENPGASCRSNAAITKIVRIAAGTTTPDLTVGFVGPFARADYRIYVQTSSVTPEAVVALYAAARISMQRAAANGSN
jgi:hypothetical protein